MKGFSIPQRNDITPGNQVIFDQLTAMLGTVPNLYASFAWSANALSTYMALENGRSSLNARQQEAIHLIVSQVNDCKYCLTAHSEIARMNGFTEEQIREILSGTATFDLQLDAMVKLARNITENRGRSDEAALNAFFSAGLSKENLVDLILVIGSMIIANYLQASINAPLDFPLATHWEDLLRDRER